jgi:nitrogen-specific signal transduction histidine kinase/CheY-like chemotaxis protein
MFAGFVGSCVDVSERQFLEEQLRQSQKMEAIGRLAGGVAHDFNNVLAVVQGYTDLLLRALARTDRCREHVEQISDALAHATGFTRQLLTLGRRQFLTPTVLELNSVVNDMQLVLRRMIGEDIELVTSLCPSAGSVEVDRAQLEQVLLNLVVNARDAMPTGGKLTIETLATVVTEGSPRHPLAPGRWVTLVVRDTGSGMDERTLARLFEPFFTTKERGKGTGLGLSIVYGIVAQSGGHVEVASEPAKGSVFTIFLREASGPSTAIPAKTVAEAPRGTETVLVVEDDAGVRKSTEELLHVLGYKVHLAEDGVAALTALDGNGETIHLVLTDVLMPGMTGIELARRLAHRPTPPRLLFMSGYLDDQSMPQGGLPPGSLLLEKPFGLARLALKVREALGEAAQPSPS